MIRAAVAVAPAAVRTDAPASAGASRTAPPSAPTGAPARVVRPRPAAPSRELPALPPTPRAALRTAPGDLAALRRRLAGATAREAVVVDFLEDDLRETEASLGEIAGWLDAVLDVLADPAVSGDRMAAIAAREPADAAEALSVALSSVRRRLAQVACGIGRGAAAPGR